MPNFNLYDYDTPDATTKGIVVAGQHTDTFWYRLLYEIPIASDPDAWIVANQAQIDTDLPTGKKLNADSVGRYLFGVEKSEASDIVAGIDDIADLYSDVYATKILKAFALVVLDEINALRADAGLPARTIAQLKSAMKGKLGGLT